MTNYIYSLIDHDHTETELAPWLAECGTGDPVTDGFILASLDCAWGHWERAARKPRHPFKAPEYLAAVGRSLWRWDDWLPAVLFGCGLGETQWRRILAAMNDLGRFDLSDTAIIRRDLSEPFDEYVLALRDDWDLAQDEACMLSDPNARDPYECVVYDLRSLVYNMDTGARYVEDGLIRFDTQYALTGFNYLTFRED